VRTGGLPLALTGQGLAYLRALYRMDPEARPQLQRGAIVQSMAERLGRR
jgi:hypothetical protein